MGKGGTKFEGDAIGSRTGRPKTVYTGKEMRANMQEFLETGRHPELEAAAQARREAAPPLPVHDPHRQHVFLDINIANKPAGRIVVELFDDMVPAAAGYFRNRCQPGSVDCLTGTAFHKVLPYNAIYGGRSSKAREPMRMQSHPRLTTQEAGCVLISLDGLEVAISLDRALNLDAAHQVVGRIHMGREIIERLNDLVNTPPDDAPLQRVAVTKCGPTNHLGVHDELEVVVAEGAPREAAAAKAQEESVNARSAVLEALEVGLTSQKRKADSGTAGPSGATAAAAAAAGTVALGTLNSATAGGPAVGTAAKVRNVKAKLLDSMLGDLSTDSESSG